MQSSPSIAVLVSGAGTILNSLLEAQLSIALVVADRPCPAIERAQAAGVPTLVLDRTTCGWPASDWDRVGFTATITAALAQAGVQLVAMAGFMTVLSPGIFAAFPGRILNTHPSLLPSFQGGHAVADALAAGARTTGCTVHIATAMLDDGPILAQASVTIRPNDTVESLQERIKIIERQLYPQIIAQQLLALSGPPQQA